MIQTKELVKIFRTDEVETTALNRVNLEVTSGEFVAVMGPSGCGKSTLLNVLGMIDKASSGKYYFFDEEISNYSERQRASLRKSNIGFVFQSFNLIDELTVYENVEPSASVHRLRGAVGPEIIEGLRSGCLPRGSVQDAAKALAPIRSLHPSGIQVRYERHP